MTTYKLKKPLVDTQDIIYRLRKRADIRRQIPNRKSVQENKPDRIADLLEEAAQKIYDQQVIIGEMDDIIDRLERKEDVEDA